MEPEPRDADLERHAARTAAIPLAGRLGRALLTPILDQLPAVPFRWVIGGTVAATLQGAPIPPGVIHLHLLADQRKIFADWLNAQLAYRWNDRWQDWGGADPDPAQPGPMRWRATVGELTAGFAPSLPEAIEIRYAGRAYPVVPLWVLDGLDPGTARLLRRIRRTAVTGR